MANYTGLIRSFEPQRRVRSGPSTSKAVALQRTGGTAAGAYGGTGGTGRIRGTVKVTVATPVARVVMLYSEIGDILLRKQLSNSVTGAFEFANLPMNSRYTAIAFDDTGVFRAEVFDKLVPEPMV